MTFTSQVCHCCALKESYVLVTRRYITTYMLEDEYKVLVTLTCNIAHLNKKCGCHDSLKGIVQIR